MIYNINCHEDTTHMLNLNALETFLKIVFCHIIPYYIRNFNVIASSDFSIRKYSLNGKLFFEKRAVLWPNILNGQILTVIPLMAFYSSYSCFCEFAHFHFTATRRTTYLAKTRNQPSSSNT